MASLAEIFGGEPQDLGGDLNAVNYTVGDPQIMKAIAQHMLVAWAEASGDLSFWLIGDAFFMAYDNVDKVITVFDPGTGQMEYVYDDQGYGGDGDGGPSDSLKSAARGKEEWTDEEMEEIRYLA